MLKRNPNFLSSADLLEVFIKHNLALIRQYTQLILHDNLSFLQNIWQNFLFYNAYNLTFISVLTSSFQKNIKFHLLATNFKSVIVNKKIATPQFPEMTEFSVNQHSNKLSHGYSSVTGYLQICIGGYDSIAYYSGANSLQTSVIKNKNKLNAARNQTIMFYKMI